MANTEQFLSVAIGAGIGFAIGGPAGALAGFQYGLLAGSVLFPADLPGVEGPRLADFEVVDADPGSPLWRIFGTVSIPGFRMYLGPVSEVATTETHGGKGAPEQDVTTYSYFQTIAIGLCEGPISGVTRIWENGDLKYDARPQQDGEGASAYAERIAASDVYAATFTLYAGTEFQTADPDLETEMAAGNVPAFRGLAYIVYPNRALTDDQARRHPQFKFEVNGLKTVDTILIVDGDTGSSATPDVYRSVAGEPFGFVGEVTTPSGGGSANYDYLEYSPELDRWIAGWAGRMSYSDDDGETWNDIGFGHPGGSNHESLVWCSGFGANGLWLAGGSNTSSYYSPTGIFGSWTASTNPGVGPTSPRHYFKAYSESLNIAVTTGTAIGGSGFSIIATDNGVAWSGAEWDVGSSFPGVSCTRIEELGYFYVTQSNGDVWRSSDGLSWSNITNIGSSLTLPAFGKGGHFAYSPVLRRLVYVHANVGIWYSDDEGESWTQVESDDGGLKVVWSDSHQKFLVAYDSDNAFEWGTLYTSVDGETWVREDIEPDSPAAINHTWFAIQKKVAQTEADRISLAEVVTEICESVGITDIDVSDIIDDEIIGYAIPRAMNARAALDPLRMVGQFDFVESGETLKFRKRGGVVDATLVTDDLGATIQGRLDGSAKPPAITTTKLQDVELPRQIRLKYISQDRNYESGEQLSASRVGTAGVNEVSVDVAVVMDDVEAAKLADIIMRDAWASRWQHSFEIDLSWLALEGADVLEIPIDGRNYRARITSINEKSLVTREIQAIRDDDGAYVSTVVNNPPLRPPVVLQQIGLSGLYFLDLPPLLDSDDNAGFLIATYNAGPGTGWDGTVLNRSVDGGAIYAPIASTTTQPPVGEVVSVVGTVDLNPGTWDFDSVLTVDVINSETLSSAVRASVLNGTNGAVIGLEDRWQIVQWLSATQIASGSPEHNRYELTGLLWGRRATEHNITPIVSGDSFVALTEVYEVPGVISDSNLEYIYRAVSNGAAFDTASDVTYTRTIERLRPFAPVRVRGTRDASPAGDLVVTWMRRDRLATALQDGVAVPLNEDSEQYVVEIIDPTSPETVVRTSATLTSPTYTYTVSDQEADWGSPLPAQVLVRIYQLSAQVGRGTPAEKLL